MNEKYLTASVYLLISNAQKRKLKANLHKMKKPETRCSGFLINQKYLTATGCPPFNFKCPEKGKVKKRKLKAGFLLLRTGFATLRLSSQGSALKKETAQKEN